MSTSYHACYFANELTRLRPADKIERLSASLFNAAVDLNPHQIDAALFSIQSFLRKGVILADEVGLGKTIEAGLVLCQYWAEQRRKLLVVCPASIRKQWALELTEKFNLPTIIYDAKSLTQEIQSGNAAPFETNKILIISLNFANKFHKELKAIQWDIVVMDEAHKLRNAYRSGNKIGQNLRWAFEDRQKLLLTATPLQNSLMELYGLTSLIDEKIFGEAASFRSLYMRQNSDLKELQERISPYTKRTLRRQVVEYIPYTQRRTFTQPFKPNDNEQKLYEAISAFMQRLDTYSIPSRQRQLITLILRKLLASSSHAIAGTLEQLKNRLVKTLNQQIPPKDILEEILGDTDWDEEVLEDDNENEEQLILQSVTSETYIERQRLEAEIADLDHYITWANSIGVDTKSRALLTALEIGFKEMEAMGANQKALVFTESRRTQLYLKNFLETNGYLGKIILFNGSNSDAESRQIYEKWVEDNKEQGRSSGSKQVNIRTALIEYFRDSASIMIATEAAADGVNLQFCSLVINYDLPWNPQRIEQRIGRCHRYGQKYDVVVVNFLNEANAADSRVLELLTEKFNLFNGIFGASDEVLGTIESGVDFEKRILEIYQQCRTTDEIEKAFKSLREELETSISLRMEETRRLLLEHFDEDVHARLRMQLSDAREQLDYITRIFWVLTKYILQNLARFDDPKLAFELHSPPRPDIPAGLYHLISKINPNIPGEFLYRLSHPLGEYVLSEGKKAPAPLARLNFDISNYPTRITLVESLKGKQGWLHLQKLTVDSFEREEYLLFSAFDQSGKSLDQETCEKLFRCNAEVQPISVIPKGEGKRLKEEAKRHAAAAVVKSMERNSQLFQNERDRLERWAEDNILASEKELSDIKEQIKSVKRQSRLAPTLDEQHILLHKLKELEKEQRRLRQNIFAVEDEIAGKRDKLIEALERRIQQKTTSEPLFTIEWAVV